LIDFPAGAPTGLDARLSLEKRRTLEQGMHLGAHLKQSACGNICAGKRSCMATPDEASSWNLLASALHGRFLS